MQLSYREEYVEVRDITVNMEFRQQLTMQQSTQPVATYLGITHKVVDGVEPKVSTTIVETNWTVESGLFLTRLLYSNVVHVVTHTFTSISTSVPNQAIAQLHESTDYQDSTAGSIEHWQ